MERKRVGNGTMRTISGSYPTREAYESGLLLPLRHEHAGTDRNPESGRSGKIQPLAARIPAEGAACEFRDFCNHLYSPGFTCNCAVAWKKRAGIAFPTST